MAKITSKQAEVEIKKLIKAFKDSIIKMQNLNNQLVIKKNIVVKDVEIDTDKLSENETEALKEAEYIKKMKKDGKLETPDEIKRLMRDVLHTEVMNDLEKKLRKKIEQELIKP